MRLTFALGLLVLALVSAIPARADFAVIAFNSGYCRVWTDTAFGPQDGRYLWFLSPYGWMYRFPTWQAADMASPAFRPQSPGFPGRGFSLFRAV
jgi:hypothetical protein